MHLVMLSGTSLECIASKWTSVLQGKQIDLVWVQLFAQQFNKYVICFHRSSALYPIGKESIIIQWKEWTFLHSAGSPIIMHLGESNQLLLSR